MTPFGFVPGLGKSAYLFIYYKNRTRSTNKKTVKETYARHEVRSQSNKYIG